MKEIKYNLDHYNINVVDFISLYNKKLNNNNKKEILKYIEERNPTYYNELKVYFDNKSNFFIDIIKKIFTIKSD